MVEIRTLSADEWELTRRLRLAALLDAPEAFGGTYEQTLLRTEEQWREWPTGGQPFAAFRDGEPVGMVCAVPSDDPAKAYLISMWVSPSARGLHIGRELVGAVAGWAREHGCTLVELDVYQSNAGAFHAYLKAGFTPIGPCPDHPGALIMHLPLPFS